MIQVVESLDIVRNSSVQFAISIVLIVATLFGSAYFFHNPLVLYDFIKFSSIENCIIIIVGIIAMFLSVFFLIEDTNKKEYYSRLFYLLIFTIVYWSLLLAFVYYTSFITSFILHILIILYFYILYFIFFYLASNFFLEGYRKFLLYR